MPADMVAIHEKSNPSLICFRVSLQARNAIFYGFTKSRADLKGNIGGVGHGSSSGAANTGEIMLCIL
jgi:hypothetical protein